jgi:asparagine synthase (glutamine-hydrolysing)
MCGICGIISKEPIADLAPLYRMQKALAHRGPDGTGEFIDANVALAMCRLSIIDILGGWQPLYNEERSIALIANAEIYNFIELRKLLESKGHRFATQSDCETIVHLYEDHGDEFVHYLRGMFAFALWDGRRKRLLLARDRMGEKPLYLYETGEQIVFASEMKALLRSQMVPFNLDPKAVDLYFHYQFVPEPGTPVKKVRKLEAAHIMSIEVNSWRINEKSYWNFMDAPPVEGNPSEVILSELKEVSRLVVRSDVPVGIALSGGFDSSAIAALTSEAYPGKLHAFSVGYSGCPLDDERRDAKAFADFLGIPFHEIELGASDIVPFFPELVYLRDDPIADISGHGYFSVMRLARDNGVPVILEGQGGDELFWGYPWVRQALEESLEKLVSRGKGWPVFSKYLRFEKPKYWGKRCLLEWSMDGFGLRHRLQRFWYNKKSPAEQLIFYDLTPDFAEALSRMPSVYTPAFSQLIKEARPESLFTLNNPGQTLDILFTRLICETYLRENGITQGDRLSMASSVELRLPLLDHHLVEVVVGLRKNYKDHRLPPKAWLKDAMERLVPPWVANRPKRGFTPPVRAWHEAVFAAYGHRLINGYLQSMGILKSSACRRLSKGGFPTHGVSPLSFKALVLELWCSQMKEGSHET